LLDQTLLDRLIFFGASILDEYRFFLARSARTLKTFSFFSHVGFPEKKPKTA